MHNLRHSALLTPSSAYKTTIGASNNSSQRNSHSNMPYRLNTALHTFCIPDTPYLPCSVAVKLQPPTMFSCTSTFTTHPCTTNPTVFHNSPMHANKKKTHTHSKMAQDVGYGGKVLWFHSHLVCKLSVASQLAAAWMKRRLSSAVHGYKIAAFVCTSFTFILIMTGAFSGNFGKLFCELKLVTDNLFSI